MDQNGKQKGNGKNYEIKLLLGKFVESRKKNLINYDYILVRIGVDKTIRSAWN